MRGIRPSHPQLIQKINQSDWRGRKKDKYEETSRYLRGSNSGHCGGKDGGDWQNEHN
jgi:hypothetical protein